MATRRVPRVIRGDAITAAGLNSHIDATNDLIASLLPRELRSADQSGDLNAERWQEISRTAEDVEVDGVTIQRPLTVTFRRPDGSLVTLVLNNVEV